MGHGLLHQSNASGRIGTVLARSKDSHGLGEKVGVGGITLRGDARRDQADLLYLEVRRGTQVAQGRGLQNLHSWVRIPPAPPSFLDFLMLSGVPTSISDCLVGFVLGKLSRSANFSSPWCSLSLAPTFAALPPRILARAFPARLPAACKLLLCGGIDVDS